MKIELAQSPQANEIFSILYLCKKSLDKQGIFQWTDNYPTLSIVEEDIKKQCLYVAVLHGRCAGIINVSDDQEPEYSAVAWTYNTGKILVIHRLAVAPMFQKQGIARALMDFAELHGIANNYSSVRLDAFSSNKRVLQFYENRGYQKRGEVFFPGREFPFFCYEKSLSICRQ